MYEELTAQARQAVTELLEAAKLKPGKIFVVGCSSSEMVGARIGKGSSLEAAQAAFAGIYPVLQAQAVAKIQITGCNGDLDHHRRRAAERREHRAQNQLPDRLGGLR